MFLNSTALAGGNANGAFCAPSLYADGEDLWAAVQAGYPGTNAALSKGRIMLGKLASTTDAFGSSIDVSGDSADYTNDHSAPALFKLPGSSFFSVACAGHGTSWLRVWTADNADPALANWAVEDIWPAIRNDAADLASYVQAFTMGGVTYLFMAFTDTVNGGRSWGVSTNAGGGWSSVTILFLGDPRPYPVILPDEANGKFHVFLTKANAYDTQATGQAVCYFTLDSSLTLRDRAGTSYTTPLAKTNYDLAAVQVYQDAARTSLAMDGAVVGGVAYCGFMSAPAPQNAAGGDVRQAHWAKVDGATVTTYPVCDIDTTTATLTKDGTGTIVVDPLDPMQVYVGRRDTVAAFDDTFTWRHDLYQLNGTSFTRLRRVANNEFGYGIRKGVLAGQTVLSLSAGVGARGAVDALGSTYDFTRRSSTLAFLPANDQGVTTPWVVNDTAWAALIGSYSPSRIYDFSQPATSLAAGAAAATPGAPADGDPVTTARAVGNRRADCLANLDADANPTYGAEGHLSFDGAGAALSLVGTARGGNAFCYGVRLRVASSAPAAHGQIICRHFSAEGLRVQFRQVQATGALQLIVLDGSAVTINSDSALPAGEWVTAVVWCDGTTLGMRINGVDQAQTATVSSLATYDDSRPITVGARRTSTSDWTVMQDFLAGDIKALAMWDDAFPGAAGISDLEAVLSGSSAVSVEAELSAPSAFVAATASRDVAAVASIGSGTAQVSAAAARSATAGAALSGPSFQVSATVAREIGGTAVVSSPIGNTAALSKRWVVAGASFSLAPTLIAAAGVRHVGGSSALVAPVALLSGSTVSQADASADLIAPAASVAAAASRYLSAVAVLSAPMPAVAVQAVRHVVASIETAASAARLSASAARALAASAVIVAPISSVAAAAHRQVAGSAMLVAQSQAVEALARRLVMVSVGLVSPAALIAAQALGDSFSTRRAAFAGGSRNGGILADSLRGGRILED